MAVAPTSASPLVRVVKDVSEKERVEMCCPNCEEWQDLLAFKNLETSTKYGLALNPIVKCGRCRHTFSPRWLNTE